MCPSKFPKIPIKCEQCHMSLNNKDIFYIFTKFPIRFVQCDMSIYNMDISSKFPNLPPKYGGAAKKGPLIQVELE